MKIIFMKDRSDLNITIIDNKIFINLSSLLDPKTGIASSLFSTGLIKLSGSGEEDLLDGISSGSFAFLTVGGLSSTDEESIKYIYIVLNFYI